MSELERDLRVLGAALDWPATPDLSVRVREQVEGVAVTRPHRRSKWFAGRLRLAPALGALLAALVAGVAAVEPARSAFLELLGIEGGQRVVRTDEPSSAPRRDPVLGELTTLGRARSQVTFPVLVPRRLGAPPVVRIGRTIAGGAVSLVYGERFVLTQHEGRGLALAEKVVSGATSVERVVVGGEPGLFISGAPHEYFVLDRDGEPLHRTARLVDANVLLWDRGQVALRLETTAGRAEALAVARSLR